jgi:hypothetical protein
VGPFSSRLFVEIIWRNLKFVFEGDEREINMQIAAKENAP